MARWSLRTRSVGMVGILVIGCMSFGSDVHAQTSAVWTGATGNWTNAALWSTNPFFPNNGNPAGSTYDVTMNGAGTITLDLDIIIQQLTLNGGAIAGTNNLTINNVFNWGSGAAGSGGILTGSGMVNANGGVNFAGLSSMTITGRTLNLLANSVWSGGTIALSNGGTLAIAPGVTFNITGNNILNVTGITPQPLLTNSGTILKSAGTGTTSIVAPLVSTGTIHVQTGTLTINNNASTYSGALIVDSGATLSLFGSATHNFNTGTTVTGAGTLSLQSTLNLNTDVTIPTLDFLSGAITGTGNLTLTNHMTWGGFPGGGGQMLGSGIVNASGGVSFEGTSSMTIAGRTLNLLADSTWVDGTIVLSAGGVLAIPNGVTFTATGDDFLNVASITPLPQFTNAGTFRKITGTGTTSITGVAVTNSGTIDIQTGTLSITNTTSTHSGAMAIGANSALVFFAGSHDFNPGTTVTGSGILRLQNTGVITLATDLTIPNLDVVNGTIQGTGNLTVNSMTWSAGTLTGSGSVDVTNGVQILTSGNKTITGRTVTLDGNSTWEAGNITLGNGSTLNLASTGSLSITGNNSVSVSGAMGPRLLNNAGTIRKETGVGITSLLTSVAFTNSGTLEIASGEFDIATGAAFTNFAANTLTGGTYRVFDNATLDFNTRTVNILAANTTVDLSGANSVFAAINPLNTVDGTFRVLDGRTFTFAGPGLTVGATGRLTAGGAGAILTVPDAIALSNFAAGTLTNGTYEVLANGTLNFGTRAISTNSAAVILNGPNSTFTAIDNFSTNSATGDFQVLGGRAFTFVNGFSNAGSITVGAGSTVNLSGFTNTGTVSNSGTAVWTGGVNITLSGTGTWTNQPGSLFDVQNNQTITNGGGTPMFVNNGTFRKSAGTGTTTVAVPFSNSGTSVEAQIGTISFTGGGTNTGVFNATGGANSLDAGTYNFNAGAAITGAGTFRVNGATLNINAAVPASNLTLESGTLTGPGALTASGPVTWNAGNMTGSGSTVANGGLTIATAGGKGLDGRALTLGGGAGVWSGGQMILANGAVFTIGNGTTLTATGDDAMFNGGGAPSFVNNGTFRKSTGTGTTTVGAPFTNSGAVEAQSGTLSFIGGGTSTGVFNATSGTNSIDLGSFVFNAGAAITGPGTFRINGASLNINAPVAATNLTLETGTLTGSGALTVSGPLTWNAGGMSGSGSTLAIGGLTIATVGVKSLDGRALTLGGGAGTWSGGTMTLSNGAALTIGSGTTLTATGDNAMNNAGGSPSFVINGTFRKSTGAGTTTVGAPITQSSSGAVDVQSGTLSLIGGSTATGSWSVASGTNLQFGGGTHNLNAGASVTGPGTVRFSSGTTNIAGSYNLTGATEVTGTVNFNSAASTGSLAIQSGFLSGSGTVTANGLTTWTGGTQNGSGTTLANGGLTISTGVAKTLDSRTLTLGGGAGTWSGGQISMANGAVFNVGAGQIFTATGHDTIVNGGGMAPTINIAGTFRKSDGGTPGTTSIAAGIGVSNSGTVDITAGNTLAIQSGLTNTGIVQIATGAALNGGVTSSGASAIVRGTGTIGGPVVMNSGSTLSPGLSPGILTVSGDVAMNVASTFVVELNGAAAGTGYDVMNASGVVSINNATLSATLDFIPQTTDVFTIITAGSIAPGSMFNNLPNGAEVDLGNNFKAIIIYGSNFVQLVNPVPEPATILAVCASAGVCCTWLRRKSRTANKKLNGEAIERT